MALAHPGVVVETLAKNADAANDTDSVVAEDLHWILKLKKLSEILGLNVAALVPCEDACL